VGQGSQRQRLDLDAEAFLGFCRLQQALKEGQRMVKGWSIPLDDQDAGRRQVSDLVVLPDPDPILAQRHVGPIDGGPESVLRQPELDLAALKATS
jgi:hypothetical protein